MPLSSLPYWILSYTLALLAGASTTVNYLTNEQLYSEMEKAHQQYPNMTHLYSIGKSVHGQDLWVIAISSSEPAEHVTLRPEAKYVANMHGNEPVGRELLIRFMFYLLGNYNSDDGVTRLLNVARIHLLPSLNPDGFDASERFACAGYTGRYNNRSQDLNRDFPDYFNPDYKDVKEVQPETASIMRWLDETQFVLSANLHTGAMVVNYPFDSLTVEFFIRNNGIMNVPFPSPDDDTFQYISRKYSHAHPNIRATRCQMITVEFEDGITNGVAWYHALGTMQDYNYAFGGCMEVTLELSCCKFPSSGSLEGLWEDNKQALLIYISQVELGVKGLVFFDDGVPASGLSIIVNSRMPVKTTDSGEFWKMLLPGNYTLKVVSPTGFSLFKQAVAAVEGSTTVYNITLPFTSNFYYESEWSRYSRNQGQCIKPACFISVLLYIIWMISVCYIL